MRHCSSVILPLRSSTIVATILSMSAIVGGVDDLGAADVEAGLLGGLGDLLGVAHQNGSQEGTGQQTGGSLQNAGIGALGEDDLAGMRLQLFDQKFKHVDSSNF